LINTYRTLITLASSVIIMTFSACVVGGNYIPADSIATSVESFQIVIPANSLSVGGKLKLTPLIRQLNGSEPVNPVIEWSVSDPTKATIDKDGNITALAGGNITITAKYKDQVTTTTLAISELPAVPVDVKNPQGPVIPG
jgi:hypothetical protein